MVFLGLLYVQPLGERGGVRDFGIYYKYRNVYMGKNVAGGMIGEVMAYAAMIGRDLE